MENQSPDHLSAFDDILSDESDDQEVSANYFREKMTTDFQLLEVWRNLSKTEERLLLHLKNMDMPFLESIVGQGLNRQLEWLTGRFRRTFPMLKAAIERNNSGSASKVETRALERFAISVSEITRLIDGEITDNLISNEVVEYSSPTDILAYARRFGLKISSLEAQIDGLHDWAIKLGLTSSGCGQTMCSTDNRCMEEPVTEEERKEVFMVGLEEDIQVITTKLIGGQTTPAVLAIVGGKGVGKTSLARQIYQNPKVAHHFHCRAWVTLPLDFEPKSFLFSIAKQVLIGFSENDDIEKIRDKLYRAWWYQRYLIVLDDAHAIEEACKTRRELSQNLSNGSTILITTTKRGLVKASPDCYVHERRVLGDEEAWELFNAKLVFQVDQEVEQLAREIVKKFPSMSLEI